jgi:hypothetical protein
MLCSLSLGYHRTPLHLGKLFLLKSTVFSKCLSLKRGHSAQSAIRVAFGCQNPLPMVPGMPVMDGRRTLAEIRKQANMVSLPVIAVTASSKAGEEKTLQDQFSGYIRKPFSRHTLFLALAQFLQRAPRGNALEVQYLAETVRCPPIPSSEQAAHWGELALELRRQEATEWLTLRNSLAVNATRNFAHNLFALGQAAHCAPLVTYAAALTTFADAYAIRQMEGQLAAFPRLVELIETSSAQAHLQPV